MTEILIVAATALAALILVDPFYAGALINAPVAKAVVLAAGMGSLTFHVLGRAVVAPQRLANVFHEMVKDWWPLLLLCAFILGGSTYAITVDRVKESFLGMGLGMLYFPLTAMAIGSSEKPLRLIKWLGGVQILLALAMLGFLFTTNHLFHESIFVAVPLGAYFLSARRLTVGRFFLGTFLLAGCAFSLKNTTFIMILASLAACSAIWALRLAKRYGGIAKVASIYFWGMAIGAFVAVVGYLWVNFKAALPSGNTEYRMEMYDLAWQSFLRSPIWGSLFTDPSVKFFRLYKIDLGSQYLPTHSDILDILGQGGIIGIALWVLVVWRIVSIGWAAASALSADPLPGSELKAWRWLFVLFLVQLNAIITYAVNPPLINPVNAFWIWSGAGAMWGLYKTLTREPLKKEQKRQKDQWCTVWM